MFRPRVLLLQLALVATGTLAACRPYSVSSGRPEIHWRDITRDLGSFPGAVTIFEGIDEKTPLHAWYARIDLESADVRAGILVSDDSDGKEPTSELARRAGACVAVNGGYFVSNDDGARHIGLLLTNNTMLRPATSGIYVDNVRYPTARAAIGFFEDGQAKVAWVTSSGDSVLAWTAPPANRPGLPSQLPEIGEAELWRPLHAVAAGPLLVYAGETLVTSDEEIFFNTPIPNVHPRTAAGIDHDGLLVLLVVDGRQAVSRGVDLPDLAHILVDLGVEYALNLDGGGSSSFVVNGRLVNRPEGGTDEREVVSGISITCLSP